MVLLGACLAGAAVMVLFFGAERWVDKQLRLPEWLVRAWRRLRRHRAGAPGAGSHYQRVMAAAEAEEGGGDEEVGAEPAQHAGGMSAQ